jgi:hypothetical protein
MAAQWISHLDEFRRRHERAVDAGLVAAAYVLTNAVKQQLRGGYTSGDFVTGRSVNAVTRSEPTIINGVRVIRVGTNLLYNLYWELGFTSAWDGKYHRVEKWRPAFVESQQEQSEAFGASYKRAMGGAS